VEIISVFALLYPHPVIIGIRSSKVRGYRKSRGERDVVDDDGQQSESSSYRETLNTINN